MEAYWIELKRFFSDHKKTIIIGTVIFSILFAIVMSVLELEEVEQSSENEEIFSPTPEEVLNDAQPAHFQIYIEYADGRSVTNSSLINQYFNLSSVKETAMDETGVNIEEVEEEALENELTDEINVINVSRNQNSNVFTLSFNLGNEQDNIIVADYYYNFLLTDELGLFEDKEIYSFVEPTIAERREEADENTATEDVSGETTSTETSIIPHIVNGFIGLALGVLLMFGFSLLRALYGKTLDYSFVYDVTEEDKFVLYDNQLNSQENISQFVTVPFGKHKIIVTEQDMDEASKNLLSGNQGVSFNKQENPEILLTEIKSLSDVNVGTKISEILIVIHPYETTRKWYATQKQLLEIYNVPTKIIQLNK